jgi:sugar phosphate isomerase/epimerase
MRFSRREFSALVGGTLGGFACSTQPEPPAEEAAAASARKKLPVAVETWCFKELLGEDPEGTLAQVGAMGYEGIELAHYYNWDKLTKETVSKALKDNGLKCCSSHLNLKSLEDENLAATIDYHKTIGNSVLIVASLPHQDSPSGWTDLAKRFDERAAKVGEQGMRLGYHNHAGDFEPMADGQVPWEIFFNNTSNEVIHQLDVGNMPKEYQDPVKYLKMYPGRTQSIHVKDRDAEHQQVLVGDGILPFAEIFELCETIGGTEWYIVEYEDKAVPPLEAVKRCLATVRQMQA